MNQSPSLSNRWSLLKISPSATEEIAIVPCDGCSVHPNFAEYVRQFSEDRYPHKTCVLSLPPLVTGEDAHAQLRYKHANTRLAVSACAENCAGRLLTALPAHSERLQLDPAESLAQQMTELEHMIKQLSEHTVGPLSSLQPPPAAQVSRKSFVQHTPTPPPETPTKASQTPKRGHFSQKNTQYGRFSGSKKKSSRVPLVLFVALLLGGLAWWFIPSNKQQAAKETQTNHTQTSERSPTPSKNGPMKTRGDIAPSNTRATKTPSRVPPSEESTPKKRTDSPEKGAEEKANQRPAPVRARPKPTPRRRAKPIKRKKPLISKTRLRAQQRINKGWTGGFCKGAEQCPGNDAICLKQPYGGLCSRFCDKFCVDKKSAAYTASYCIGLSSIRKTLPKLPSFRYGLCLSKCDKKRFPRTGCRIGTVCKRLPLRKRSKRVEPVCVPVSVTSLTNGAKQ